jgi:phosphoglycerate-specific signal transduction histidine kinase
MALTAMMALSCQKAEQKQTVQELAYEIEKEQGSEYQPEKNVADSTVNNHKGALTVSQPASREWDRKIIKIANVSLELKDYHSFNNSIHLNLKSFGAYIAQEQQTQNEGEISNNVTIKVPVDQFDNVMNYLSTVEKNAKVIDKQITSEDVSTQVVDAKSRIETKKRLRDKYFELMNNSKKMDDIIKVQNEISSITEDIEAASSRVQYMSHQSAYSTINLKYFQVLNAAKVDNTSPTFFTSFADAFKRGASFIGDLLLFFVSIWPLLIGGTIAWYFIKKKVLQSKPQQVSNMLNVQVSDTTKAH